MRARLDFYFDTLYSSLDRRALSCWRPVLRGSGCGAEGLLCVPFLGAGGSLFLSLLLKRVGSLSGGRLALCLPFTNASLRVRREDAPRGAAPQTPSPAHGTSRPSPARPRNQPVASKSISDRALRLKLETLTTKVSRTQCGTKNVRHPAFGCIPKPGLAFRRLRSSSANKILVIHLPRQQVM